MQQDKELILQETICCGRKRCPVIRVFSDGSAELTDDDIENGSVGKIKLRPEVAARIVELLSSRGA